MSSFNQLLEYIQNSRKIGISDEKIAQMLAESGWNLTHVVGVISDAQAQFQTQTKPKKEGGSILVEGISKSFGKLEALKDIHLEVPTGTVTALLGPNGAGKTTLVRILTTLLSPNSGHAVVADYDVVRDADKLRSVIGLTGQFTAIDDNLTGRENLDLVGRLYHLGQKFVKEKSTELLEKFELSDAADRYVKTYSGGMKRRLDLAMSLIHSPKVLFLDEPTTGLDPHSRLRLWAIIEDLVAQGTTVLLTTQYLEEADRLADSIIVLNQGQIIARGTADELKDQVGGNILELHVSDHQKTDEAASIISSLGHDQPHIESEEGRIMLPIQGGAQVLADAIRLLDSVNIKIEDIYLRRPTLDDVFLALTGHSAE